MTGERREPEVLLEKCSRQWLNSNFASADCDFRSRDAVRFKLEGLNPLLNMAELRKFDNTHQPFDPKLLTDLRDGTIIFATKGKVTAQHLPLPRPELNQGSYTYYIGHQSYPVAQITPGFHASRQFLTENFDTLPIGDYQKVIVQTQIQKEDKTIGINKSQAFGLGTSIIRDVALSRESLFSQGFKATVDDPLWSISLFKDATDTNKYWVEMIVNTAEHYGNRRELFTPYVVGIETNPETITRFIQQVEKAITLCQTEEEKHELLYFLTSVLYFQASPKYPYLPPDIKPGVLNESLPFDLYSVSVGIRDDTIAEAPKLFRRALKKKDGFKVIEKLYNSDPHSKSNLDSVIAELKKAFGPEYEALAYSIKAGLQSVADEVEDQVNKEVARRLERDHIFDDRWESIKPLLIHAIGRAVGYHIVDSDSAVYRKVTDMMKLDEEIDSTRLFSRYATLTVDEIVKELQEKLITTAMITYSRQLITEILRDTRTNIRTHTFRNTKKLLRSWNSVTEEAEKWGISKDDLTKKYCNKMDSRSKTVEEAFKKELMQAKLKAHRFR